jgi:hypothetical protein
MHEIDNHLQQFSTRAYSALLRWGSSRLANRFGITPSFSKRHGEKVWPAIYSGCSYELSRLAEPFTLDNEVSGYRRCSAKEPF